MTRRCKALESSPSSCYGGGVPQVAMSSEGIVYFRGEMCLTSGTNQNAFTLAAGLAPSEEQWIVVDECGGYTGRMEILADGAAYLYGDPNTSGNAAFCFTSLDGVEFAP